MTEQQKTIEIEKALVGGDLARLNADQRVEYYNKVCTSLGLNPLTQPLAYTTLNGKLQLYARKDATDQLRRIYDVSVDTLQHDFKETLGLYVVTAIGKRGGRNDASTGAVSVKGLSGDNLANAIMKAETKAKRRLTLSLCGLGMLDVSEVESSNTVVSEPDSNLKATVVTVPAVNQVPATPTEKERPNEEKKRKPSKPKEKKEDKGTSFNPAEFETKPIPAGNIHGVDITDDDLPDFSADTPPPPTGGGESAPPPPPPDRKATPEEKKIIGDECKKYAAVVGNEALKNFVLRISGEKESSALTKNQWDRVLGMLAGKTDEDLKRIVQ